MASFQVHKSAEICPGPETTLVCGACFMGDRAAIFLLLPESVVPLAESGSLFIYSNSYSLYREFRNTIPNTRERHSQRRAPSLHLATGSSGIQTSCQDAGLSCLFPNSHCLLVILQRRSWNHEHLSWTRFPRCDHSS